MSPEDLEQHFGRPLTGAKVRHVSTLDQPTARQIGVATLLCQIPVDQEPRHALSALANEQGTVAAVIARADLELSTIYLSELVRSVNAAERRELVERLRASTVG